MLYDVHQKTLDSLKEVFGHRPDERGGEKWAVYQDSLIVIHPARKPRLYKQGCAGAFTELEPNLSGTGVIFEQKPYVVGTPQSPGAGQGT